MRKGGITVFVSLILAASLMLFLALTEATAVFGAKHLGTLAGEAALDSIFAGYDRTLLEEYGLLFYDGGFGTGLLQSEKIEKSFSDYFEKNAGTRDLLAGGSFFQVNLEKAVLRKAVTATDYKGELLIRSVMDFFPFEEAGLLREKMEKDLNVLEKGEAAETEGGAAKDALQETDWGALAEKGEGESSDVDRAVEKAKTPAGEAETPTEDPEETKPPFDQERYEETVRESVVGMADEIKASGWLNLVLPEGKAISGITVSGDELPSRTAWDERTLLTGDALEKAAGQAVVTEYAMRHFGNFSQAGSGKSLHYGVEYLLFGELSDEANFRKVIEKILWMREGMNLLYLLSDSTKREEAMTMSRALLGWTGIPGLPEVMGVAILGAWAFGESVLDTRMLLSGKKVALLKTRETWALSLESVPALLKGQTVSGQENRTGLSYADYLRLMLYTTEIHTLAYRAMDLIQLSVQEGSPHFLMSAAIYGLEIETSERVRPVFTALPLFRVSDVQKGFHWTHVFSGAY